MRNSIKIVPNVTTNELVTPSKTNPAFGFIILEQSTLSTKDGWVRKVKRSTIQKGLVEDLLELVDIHTQRDSFGNPPEPIQGKLIVKEYVESEVPEALVKAYINSDLAYEEGIARFIKRPGKDGPECTLGGERILRFTIHSTNPNDLDISVQHDNIAECTEWKNQQINADKASKKQKEAVL